jgi:hypothetical protein
VVLNTQQIDSEITGCKFPDKIGHDPVHPAVAGSCQEDGQAMICHLIIPLCPH